MEDRFLYEDEVFNRLLKEYQKHPNLIVGVDFDNTVFDFHNVGDTYPLLIQLLKDCQDLGFVLCLYTGNTDIAEIAKFQVKHDIKFPYINVSPVKPTSSNKPYFNILLDDRAGLESAYVALTDLIAHIRVEKAKQ